MPILGLALTLVSGAEPRLRARLVADPRVEIGTPQGSRLPIVLETRRAGEEQAFLAGLLDSGHVLTVDVAFASFEDLVLHTEEETKGGPPT